MTSTGSVPTLLFISIVVVAILHLLQYDSDLGFTHFPFGRYILFITFREELNVLSYGGAFIVAD